MTYNIFTLRFTLLYIVVLLSGFLTKAQDDSLTTIYSESFEDGLGQFSQSTNDNFDWTRKSGSTPSFHTGPSSAADGSYLLKATSGLQFTYYRFVKE